MLPNGTDVVMLILLLFHKFLNIRFCFIVETNNVHAVAEIVGVNNRNLHTFEVSLDTSLNLADRIPTSVLKVTESGIETRQQIGKLQEAGYHAFLIGEHLMRSGDPTAALKALTS